MHKFSLKPFDPMAPSDPMALSAVMRVDAVLQMQDDGGLLVEYLLSGDIGSVRVPPIEPAGFRDGLWRHTCFELFAAADGSGYREFNFSPSACYAVYDFSGYRAGMQRVAPASPPAIRIAHEPFSLTVRIPAALLPPQRNGERRLGVAAVVEHSDGSQAYWAAHHPREKPDFHDAAGFVVSLPAGGQPGGAQT